VLNYSTLSRNCNSDIQTDGSDNLSPTSQAGHDQDVWNVDDEQLLESARVHLLQATKETQSLIAEH
jgi:hypothetical protein